MPRIGVAVNEYLGAKGIKPDTGSICVKNPWYVI
jgi:hypothetical protein